MSLFDRTLRWRADFYINIKVYKVTKNLALLQLHKWIFYERLQKRAFFYEFVSFSHTKREPKTNLGLSKVAATYVHCIIGASERTCNVVLGRSMEKAIDFCFRTGGTAGSVVTTQIATRVAFMPPSGIRCDRVAEREGSCHFQNP